MTDASTEVVPTGYPALLEIDYPDRELNWVTSFFRPILVVPIAVILALLSSSEGRSHSPD